MLKNMKLSKRTDTGTETVRNDATKGSKVLKRYLHIVSVSPRFYSPALKKWGYTGFTLSFRRSVLPGYSVIPSFRYSIHNSVTTHNLRTSC